MIVTRREDLVSTGCTTSAAFVVHITPGLSRAMQIVPHQIEVGVILKAFLIVLICRNFCDFQAEEKMILLLLELELRDFQHICCKMYTSVSGNGRGSLVTGELFVKLIV